jgi:hypothetical protein
MADVLAPGTRRGEALDTLFPIAPEDNDIAYTWYSEGEGWIEFNQGK